MKNLLFLLIYCSFSLLFSCKKTEEIPSPILPPTEEPDTTDPNAPNPNPRTWYVATNGNDANDGTLEKPLKTIQKAADKALKGDVLELRGGTHESKEIKIRKNLTLRSYKGEWAIIKATTDIEDITSVLWYREPKITAGVIENLEIIGGYFYGIKLENNWEDNEPVRNSVSNLIIRNCKIHDTGRDCIKIVPGCADIQVLNCEIYRSGVGIANKTANNAEGIDNVNAPRMIVRNCYFHDIATNGLYAKGGAKNCLIENNLVMNCGEAGIVAGFLDTDEEWFDKTNTNYYESFDITIRNNIVVNTNWEGVGLYAAVRPLVYNNTFINVGKETHAALYMSRGEVFVGNNGKEVNPPCVDVTIQNNIFTQNAQTNRPMVGVRGNLSGNNDVNFNQYFKTGNGATYDDGKVPEPVNFTKWKTATKFDANTNEADPKLDNQHHLLAGSPCVDTGKIINTITKDYDGGTRTGKFDIGADEYNNGKALTIPPPTGTIGTGNL